METLTGNPREETVPDSPGIFNTQFSRRRLLQGALDLGRKGLVTGVAAGISEGLSLSGALLATAEDNEPINTLEVTKYINPKIIATATYGERLATLFTSADNKFHAGLIRPDPATASFVGNEVRIPSGITPDGIEPSLDGSLVIVYGTGGNPNEVVFSLNDQVFVLPNVREIINAKISSDNKLTFFYARRKDNPETFICLQFNLNSGEIRPMAGELAAFVIPVRPLVRDPNTYVTYYANPISRSYIQATIDPNGSVSNKVFDTTERLVGLDEIWRPNNQTLLGINNDGESGRDKKVATILINENNQYTGKVYRPDLVKIGDPPPGYTFGAIDIGSSCEYRATSGSNNPKALAGIIYEVIKVIDSRIEAFWIPKVGGFSVENPQEQGFYTTNGLPTLIPRREIRARGAATVLKSIHTQEVDGVTVPVTSIMGTMFFYNEKNAEWQTGPISLRR